MSCFPRVLLAILGSYYGPIGTVVGFIIGGLFDGSNKQVRQEVKENIGDTSQKRDFNVSLLMLSAAVMKADGVVKKSELDYVKRFFLNNFGQKKAEIYIKMLREILNKDLNLYDVAQQIKQHVDYASRLQLLHYLFGIAKSDGFVSKTETDILHTIASYIGLYENDYESIKAMFIPTVNEMDNAYKILGINASASDDEVKKAYRDMAKKFHPDLVSHLGEDVRQDAEKKLQDVNAAYDKIKKSRGLS